MALQVWLPLNGNLNNLGVSNLNFSVYQSTTTVNSAGKIGSCYTNNSNSSGGIVSDTKINLGNYVSMFCWVKMTSFYSGSSLTGILGQHRYPTCEGLGITMRYVSSTTGYISINTGNGSDRTYNTYYGSTLLNAGTWYHVGFTYNNGAITFYVNGKPDGTATYANKNIEDYIQIFGWSFASSSITNDIYGGYTLNGYLNDVRVYDHCLSEREVYEISKGLVVHYPLNDPFVEETTNLNSPNWYAFTSYFTIQSQSQNEIVLRKAASTTYLALLNETLRSKLVASTPITVSCYLYKNGAPYKTGATGITTYNSVTVINVLSRNDGYYEITFKFGNLDSEWIIHYPIFDSCVEGDVCVIKNMQWEIKDHATGYTENARGFKYDPQVYTEPDGSHWARIAHHNNPANAKFSSSNSFANGVYLDTDRWFNVYSVVNRLNSYEFMVKQISTSSSSEVKYRWIQYTSPLTATYANVAPSAVTRITTSGYTDGGYGGLYILNSNTHMVIANTSNGNWYGAFGCWGSYDSGIPGYPNTTIRSGYMDLYVRVDSIELPKIEDTSGYEHHGEIIGLIENTNSSKRYNNCIKLSSTETNYINIPSSYISPSYNDHVLTYSFWIKPYQLGNRHMIFGIKNSYYTNIELYTENQLRVYWNGTPDWFPGIICTTNEWTHVAIVLTSTYIKCYKNGVLVGTNTTVPSWAGVSGDYMIGSDQRIGTYFPGFYLSDFRIYATALSDSDIQDLYSTSAYVDNKNSMISYQLTEQKNNIVFNEEYGIVSKQWLGGLSSYTQSHCQCSLTDTGYRIYRTPNKTYSGDGSVMWGGFVLRNGNNNLYGFTKGHRYMIQFEVKGQTSNGVGDIYWTNQVGWGGGGLEPSPSNVERYNPVTENYNDSEWKTFTYKWTINDDVYKVCTTSYSSFVEGTTYMSYRDFKYGFGYRDTGTLGTDLYIRNLRLYDITYGEYSQIYQSGIVEMNSFIEDEGTARIMSDGTSVMRQNIEI